MLQEWQHHAWQLTWMKNVFMNSSLTSLISPIASSDLAAFQLQRSAWQHSWVSLTIHIRCADTEHKQARADKRPLGSLHDQCGNACPCCCCAVATVPEEMQRLTGHQESGLPALRRSAPWQLTAPAPGHQPAITKGAGVGWPMVRQT